MYMTNVVYSIHVNRIFEGQDFHRPHVHMYVCEKNSREKSLAG